MCNPTICLQKNNEDVVMTVGIATISPASLKRNKRTSIVTLKSHPLPVNKWINAVVQFTVYDSPKPSTPPVSGMWKEESCVELYIDNGLHAAAKDQFGRYL